MARKKVRGPITNQRCLANVHDDEEEYEACGEKLYEDLNDDWGYVCPIHGEMR
jgi:hypothetical protein